jgi:hypothetical protein
VHGHVRAGQLSRGSHKINVRGQRESRAIADTKDLGSDPELYDTGSVDEVVACLVLAQRAMELAVQQVSAVPLRRTAPGTISLSEGRVVVRSATRG